MDENIRRTMITAITIVRVVILLHRDRWVGYGIWLNGLPKLYETLADSIFITHM